MVEGHKEICDVGEIWHISVFENEHRHDSDSHFKLQGSNKYAVGGTICTDCNAFIVCDLLFHRRIYKYGFKVLLCVYGCSIIVVHVVLVY
jgi:hypothetical protein